MLNIQNYIANTNKALYPKHAQQKAAGLALTGYNSLAHTVRLSGFFCAYYLYAFAFYGEAGEGHFRVCWFPIVPVDQPFSALPPSFGREWQSSFKINWSA